MKLLKPLVVGLLLVAPFSLSAASGDSFLVREASVQPSGARAMTLLRKDSAGVTTKVAAERISVENEVIRCVGNVTITRENVTIHANEIVFEARQSRVFFLNSEGVTVSDIVPTAGTRGPLEFRGRFPATNTGLTR